MPRRDYYDESSVLHTWAVMALVAVAVWIIGLVLFGAVLVWWRI